MRKFKVNGLSVPTRKKQQKLKINGLSVPKTEWKQTDGRTDGQTGGGDCITCRINAVSKYNISVNSAINLFINSFRSLANDDYSSGNR